MKSVSNTLVTLTLLSLTSAAIISCTSEPANDTLSSNVNITEAHVKGVPGGVTTAVAQLSAKVSAIDYKKRSVTLQDEKGNKKTLLIGPEAINFEQVKVGDLVNVAYAEELVVYLRGKNDPAKDDGAAGIVARAPEGNKPAVLMADTMEVTAVVKSVDLKAHSATLQFPDGSLHTVAVRADVDLKKAKIGQEVVIRTTSAIALTVEKP